MTAYRKFGWGTKPSRPTDVPPLQAAVDPQHLHPSDAEQIAAGNALWVASPTAVPTLPADMVGGSPAGTVAPGGPIDMGPYFGPSYGVGVGPGLTVLESQDVRGALMSQDDGAVAAHATDPMTQRYDGSGPHVAVIYDEPGLGNSPRTPDLKITGVGGTDDPYARTGKRIKRWWDRKIDMHRYGVEYRPMINRSAKQQPVSPVPAGSNQLVSPFPTNTWLTTPNRFLAPQVRRTPPPWDEQMATDGVNSINDAGLTVWGL